MPVDASMWKGAVGEVSCAIGSCIIIFGTHIPSHSIFYFIMGILYIPFCVQSTELLCLYTLDIGL